jgi:hypothetical protein
MPQERDALLPAVATLLRATPEEYKVLKAGIDSSGAATWFG